jgi:radical SAM superfamily enzyme YgiQ (UPF0313 family)
MKVLFLFLTERWLPYNPSIAALSAAVKAEGHEAECLSIPLDSSIKEAAARIAERGADVIGASVMTRDWPGIRALYALLRRSTRAFLVVGGYHATLAPRDVARSDADAICVGEGELALPALLGRLSRGERPGTFPGMWVRGAEGWTDPPPAGAGASDIASLPRWDYDVFGDMSEILARGINIFGTTRDRFLPTRASRGCPFDCTYCSAPTWEKAAGFDGAGKRNVRPVEHLCDELAELKERYRPGGFEFWDEHFPIDLGWLAELGWVYPRRVGLPFRMEMHPSAASRQRLELLAQAGCELFHCGVEAGDPEYRRNILRRRTSDAALERVFADARELGLRTSTSVMMALPNETLEQAQKTLALLRRLRPSYVVWSTYTPLPGTPLGEENSEHIRPDPERLDNFQRVRDQPRFPRMSGEEINLLHQQYAELQRELSAG